MGVDLWMWIVFAVLVAGLLALDLGVLHRDDRPIGLREALWMSLPYIALAHSPSRARSSGSLDAKPASRS